MIAYIRANQGGKSYRVGNVHSLNQIVLFVIAADCVHGCVLGLEICIVGGSDLEFDNLVDAVQRAAVGHGAALCAADDVDVLNVAVLGQ